MSVTGSGHARYPKRIRTRLPDMRDGAVDLGTPLRPQDVLIELRHLEQLEDGELLDIFAAADPHRLARAWPELTEADVATAIDQAAAVSRSRLNAWRRRARDMTWLELRVLLTGLRDLMLGKAAAIGDDASSPATGRIETRGRT